VFSSAKLDTVTTAPPLPPVVVFSPNAGTAAKPTRPDGVPPLVEVVVLLLEEDELLEELVELVEPVVELDELELELLLDDELEELVEPVVEVVELEELLLEDEEELDDDELLLEVELVLPEPLGIEHSFTPPGTLVPAPKVTSPQTKLPLSSLKVN
jgi:hypothetical protein